MNYTVSVSTALLGLRIGLVEKSKTRTGVPAKDLAEVSKGLVLWAQSKGSAEFTVSVTRE